MKIWATAFFTMRFLIQQQGLDRADKIQLMVSYILQLILLGTIFFSLYDRQWLNSFAVAGILLLTFLPKMLRQRFNVFLPIEFDFIAIVFIFLAIFLGEVHGYYTLFWWWDIILHTGSGLLFGIAGFVLVYVLNEEKRMVERMKPGFIALFGFAFAVAWGALWEIFEFSMDFTFGTQMQRSGLVDTMGDLIVDTLGAAAIALLGYFFIRKGKWFVFDRLIHRFVEKNPRLFSRKA